MDSQELVETIRSERETELSRLGSSKSVYAATGGEMEADAVYWAAADRAAAAAAVFGSWAGESADGDAGDVFESVAADAREHRDRSLDQVDDYEPTAEDAAADALRDLDGPAARLGGLVGYALVADRTLAQMVGFFVGSADTRAADAFREFRTDAENWLDGALAALDGRNADWDVAHAAAELVVEAAYADYVEALESMGVKVKPVC